MKQEDEAPILRSPCELIDSLLQSMLGDESGYDRQIVELVRKHLGTQPIQSRASQNLTADLERLAYAKDDTE